MEAAFAVIIAFMAGGMVGVFITCAVVAGAGR